MRSAPALKPCDLLGVDELEALAERAAVILDRLPELRVGRVVDDADAFEVRIVQPRHRIQRLLQHLHRFEIGGDVDRDFRKGDGVADGGRRHRLGALGDQPARAVTEGDCRDFVDPRHRDQDQRHQQDQAERQRKGRAEYEIMPGPIGEYGGSPGADAVGRHRKHQRLHHGGPVDPQDRQRHQDADEQRDRGELPVVLVHDRAGPGEFRFAGGVENAPIGSDAAFEEFPGLIDRLDDVVFHADRFGAGDEVAQHRGLFERAGFGVAQIVAGARPAEFGDDDALAGEFLAQQAIEIDRLIHRLLVGEVFPIGQDVGGDEIDGGAEFGIVAPDVPDFACGDGNVDRLLHPLDQLDQVFDLLLAAVDGFVADDDAVDVAVALGEVDRRVDLALVAVGILVDPGADGDLEAELGRDRRHQFDAAGRGVETNRARHRRQLLQVGADFLDLRDIVDVGMGAALERRIGDARQDAAEIGRRLFFLEQTPQPGMSCGYKQQNGYDGAHRGLNHTGLQFNGSEPVP